MSLYDNMSPGTIDLLVESLILRKNQIETGNPLLGAQDLIDRNQHDKLRKLSKSDEVAAKRIENLISYLALRKMQSGKNGRYYTNTKKRRL